MMSTATVLYGGPCDGLVLDVDPGRPEITLAVAEDRGPHLVRYAWDHEGRLTWQQEPTGTTDE